MVEHEIVSFFIILLDVSEQQVYNSNVIGQSYAWQSGKYELEG